MSKVFGLGREVKVDVDDSRESFTTITLEIQGDAKVDENPKELTPEEKAAQAAKEQQELLARCAEDRRIAKEAMLARNAVRIKELGSKLKPGETLEQYDDRVKGEE